MNTLIKVLACLFVLGSVAACDSGGGGGTDCKTMTTHVVTLLKAQGDDAMLKEADIPKLTEGCTKADVLNKKKADVECVMKAKDVKSLQECPGSNNLLKDIMKGAG